MARRALTATTLAATAALLLTACGSGGDTSPDDIKGADTGTASPSASAPAAAGGDRPDVSLPKDLQLSFAFDKPSDPKHAAALSDAQNYIRALDHGIAQQDPADPAYQFYSTGQAAQYAKSQIEAWVKGKWAPTGKDEYYDEQVTTLSGGKRVLVTFCRNQAKFYGKEIKTGKVLYTKESLSSYQKYSLLMFPPASSGEAWKAQLIEVKGKVEECRR